MFWRRKAPDGSGGCEEFEHGMNVMESHYCSFVQWAYSYISLLEKQLEQQSCDRCRKRQNCNGEKEEHNA